MISIYKHLVLNDMVRGLRKYNLNIHKNISHNTKSAANNVLQDMCRRFTNAIQFNASIETHESNL